MRRALPALLSLVASCSGSARPAPPPPAPSNAPELLERPIWDGPLDDADANRLLERVRTSLALPPPTVTGKDPGQWGPPIKLFIEKRVALGRAIKADVERLSQRPDPRIKLLAAVSLAVASDDLVTDLTSIQLPSEVKAGQFGADIERVFRDSMEEHALPVIASARIAFEHCRQLAPIAPAVLQPWAGYCGDRSTELGALEARIAERTKNRPPPKPVARPPALFADCGTGEPLRMAPTALTLDPKVKPSVMYTYTSEDIDDPVDIAKLEAAVAARLGKDTGMRVVSGKELAAARKLVTQKKLHARAPACGQAPPLSAVVAHARKHVVIGEISSTCIYDDVKSGTKPRCGLFVDYRRAGGTDHDGLPGPMFAPVSRRDAPASEYLAAVDSLAPDKPMAGLLGSLRQDSPIFTKFSGTSDEDPWLRVAWILRDDTEKQLASCVDAAGSFDATFTITRDGKTKNVTLAPVTAPPAGSTLAACVKSALEATPWPCTRDGKPAAVSVRMCVAPRPR